MAYSLGLDLGTTYAVAAVARGGRVEVVTLGHRATAIPTVLHLDGETVLVGDAAARRATTEPGRVAREFKRRVGGAVPVIVDGRPFAAEALLACVARWLLDEVTRSEGEAPVALTITYPATWQGHRLALLRDAMAATGVRAVGGAPAFLDEPTAAATYYAQHRPIPPGGLLAVYDLGGGTFDATVVRRTERGFEVVGTPAGLDRVGGLDVDQAVFDHVLAAVGLTADDLDAASPEVAVAVERLRGECVVAKEALSSDTAVTIPVLLPGRHAEVRLTRAELEDLVRPLLDETVGALAHALESAKVAPADLVGVLLVGGSSRIPLVAQLVAAAVGAPVLTDARPKDVTAMGAAVHQGAAAVTPVLPPPSPPLPPPPRLPPPSLPPPSLPPSPPAAGNAVRWIAAAVAAVAVLVGAALAVAASGGGGGDDPPDGSRSAIEATTTASSGATTTTVPVAIFAVAAGDCLAVVPAAGELEQEAQLADCEGQHQGEAFATFTYAGGDEAPYPGDDAVREEGLARCTEAFAEFIGITFEESVLQVRVFRPSSASWRLGDRVAYCVVHEDGAPIVGSLEGSRR